MLSGRSEVYPQGSPSLPSSSTLFWLSMVKRPTANKCVCLVLCTMVHPFLQENDAEKPKSTLLLYLLFQDKLGISLGFSCKQLSWEESDLRGRSLGAMPSRTAVTLTLSRFGALNLRVDGVSVVVLWSRAVWCKLENASMLSTVSTWHKECLLN